MDLNAEKDAIEKKVDELVGASKGKVSEFWAKFRYYVIGGAALVLLVIGLIYLGQWYASGKARELTEALHNQFRQENQAIYDNIAVNAAKIKELKITANSQGAAIAKLKKTREGGIIDVINQKDPKKLANLYDNLVDSYSKPVDFGK